MILIISQPMEYTTSEVCRWLRHWKVPHVRLHPEDLQEGGMHYELGAGSRTEEPEKNRTVQVDPVGAERWQSDEVNTVWYRRWSQPRQLMQLWKNAGEPELDKVRRHLGGEFATLTQTLIRHLGDVKWLNHPSDNHLNKIDVLEKALEAGFDVPETLITGKKAALSRFIDQHGAVISKPVKEVDFFPYHGDEFSLYTVRFTADELEDLPDTFFPTLFQRQIPKQYEIRTFYLGGECYSMAIFSQADKMTELDFRRYNHGNMNQMVPFNLPAEQEAAADRLMKALNMDSGSLDIIRDTEGRYVFLEVNPVGQFGMVSRPCHYQLEEKVARFLRERTAKTETT
ncbi:grasp-with-spasm system ATP-grasp peptide maturase [Roseivirga sp. BDSF3-8]|uniref:grasp-with-spasm system ATP-grasp peptide maturase n=1 Tax=Roseivirga sp. BDSF3-8 TaxID=3241598 RepID=UPI003531E86F